MNIDNDNLIHDSAEIVKSLDASSKNTQKLIDQSIELVRKSEAFLDAMSEPATPIEEPPEQI